MADKVYVSVLAMFDQDVHHKAPGVIWPDGRKYGIDTVLDIRKVASYRACGTGMRYTCEINGKIVFLYDEECQWFMEGLKLSSLVIDLLAAAAVDMQAHSEHS